MLGHKCIIDFGVVQLITTIIILQGATLYNEYFYFLYLQLEYLYTVLFLFLLMWNF